MEIPIYVDFSPEGIKALRMKRNLTRAEFAAIIGVTPPTIWMWENEVTIPGAFARKQIRIYAAQI